MKKRYSVFMLLFFISNTIIGQQIKVDTIDDYTWKNRRFYFETNQINPPPQNELLEYLENIHTSVIYNYRLSFLDFNVDNSNKEVKERLIEIVSGKWTYRELKWLFEKTIGTDETILNSNISEEFVKQKKIYQPATYSQRLQLYNHLYDSLIMPYKVRMENEINNTPISNDILLAVGWLNLKDAIPILIKALNNNDKRFDKRTLILVLAKLNYKDAIKKAFEFEPYTSMQDWANQQQNIEFTVYYIGTQESIFKLNTLMDTKIRCPMSPDDGANRGYIAGYLLTNLLKIIKNKPLQEMYKGLLYGDGLVKQEKLNSEIIDNTKKWLFNNKGKYEINSNWLNEFLNINRFGLANRHRFKR